MTNTIEDKVMTNIIEKSTNSNSPHQHLDDDTSNIQTRLIESLNFDDTAKQMDALKALIFNPPETNQTKIQFIKEELSAGRYQIHSKHIVASLMEYVGLIEEPEIA